MPPADTVSKTVARTETDPPQKRPAAPKTPQTAPAVHPTDGPAPMEGVQITEQPVDRKRAKIDEVRDLAHLAELLTTTHAGGDVQLGEMVVPVPMQSSAGSFLSNLNVVRYRQLSHTAGAAIHAVLNSIMYRCITLSQSIARLITHLKYMAHTETIQLLCCCLSPEITQF